MPVFDDPSGMRTLSRADTAILIDPLAGPNSTTLTRIPLAGDAAYDERWLQKLIYQHPGLIPMEQIEPGSGPFVALTREFALSKEGGSVFLDVLGVTPRGRITLVECKLWRNPQARREVVAQVLEYAALLRGWTYADLTAKLKTAKGLSGPNPVFAEVARIVPALDEATFVDAVNDSLAAGDFHLVIAGDGIRSDLRSIADHINTSGLSNARLSLVAIQLWADATGRVVVTPQVPLRTEVIEQRVLIGHSGMPLGLQPSPPVLEGALRLGAGQTHRAVHAGENRQFWQRFIDTMHFDHPDQRPPRHGGNNWTRIDLPSPLAGITAYRTAQEVGLFVRVTGERGILVFATIVRDLELMRRESGLDLSTKHEQDEPFRGTMTVSRAFAPGTDPSEEDQLVWLRKAANDLVTSLRPRLPHWQSEIEREDGQVADGILVG